MTADAVGNRPVSRILAAAVLAAVVGLTGCSADPITSGYVTERQHIPAHDYTVSVSDYVYTCFPTTRYNGTSYVVVMDCGNRYAGSHTEWRHAGPVWRFKVRDDADHDRVDWVNVAEADYDRYDVDSHWPDLR